MKTVCDLTFPGNKHNLNALVSGKAIMLHEEEVNELLEIHGQLLRYIECPTRHQRRVAIQSDADAIALVMNPTLQEKLLAVQRRPTALRFISNPSVHLQLEAVRRDPSAIQFIAAPARKVQIEAVLRDGMVLRHIAEIASYEVRLVALMQNGEAIAFIRKPTETEMLAALMNTPWAVLGINGKIRMSTWNQIEAIRLNPAAIGNIENLNEESRMEALKQDCEVAMFMMPLNSKEHLAYCIGYACKFDDYIINPDLLPEELQHDQLAIARLQDMIDCLVKTEAPWERIVSLCVHSS